MILNKDFVHDGKIMKCEKDTKHEVLIKGFNDSLALVSDEMKSEYKRFFDDNNVLFDVIPYNIEPVFSIDTDIGTVYIFNLGELVLNRSANSETISKTLLSYLHSALHEEKLNGLSDEGRLIYKEKDKVVFDGFEYDVNDSSFNGYTMLLERVVNTYIFERLVKSSILVCNVPYEDALNDFLALTCDWPSSAGIH